MIFQQIAAGICMPVRKNNDAIVDSNYVETPPESPIAEGKKGQYSMDENYVYFCYEDNSWIAIPAIKLW